MIFRSRATARFAAPACLAIVAMLTLASAASAASFKGVLVSAHGHGDDGTATPSTYALVTPSGATLQVLPSSGKIPAAGTSVDIKGEISDGKIVANRIVTRKPRCVKRRVRGSKRKVCVRRKKPVRRSNRSLAVRALGARSLLIVPVGWDGIAAPDPAAMRPYWIDDPTSSAAYLRTISHGRATVEPVVLDQAITVSAAAGCSGSWEMLNEVRRQLREQRNIETGNFNHVMLVYTRPDCSGSAWGSLGSATADVPGTIWVNNATKPAPINGARSFGHEMGHNVGLYHSGAPCALTDPRPVSAACEYGDTWDMMGGNPVAQAANVFEQLHLGWLDDASAPITTTSGLVSLQPLSGSAAGRPVGVRIGTGDNCTGLSAEFRSGPGVNGFDAYGPGSGAQVSLHWLVPGELRQDTSGAAAGPCIQTVRVAQLSQGQAFTDSRTGVRVTVDHVAEGEQAVVRIEFPGQPPVNPFVAPPRGGGGGAGGAGGGTTGGGGSNRGDFARDSACRSGQVASNGKCVTKRKCPAGKVQKGRRCIRRSSCRDPYKVRGSACVRVRCRKGYQLNKRRGCVRRRKASPAPRPTTRPSSTPTSSGTPSGGGIL